MIGFSIEFKKWFVVLRGPHGRVYCAFGFAKDMPVFSATKTYTASDTDLDWEATDDEEADEQVED